MKMNTITKYFVTLCLPRCCFAVLMLVSFAVFCKSPLANAQTFFGAAPEALGDAGRAANDSIEGHYLNPASLAFGNGYRAAGAYQTISPSLDSPSSNFAFVVTDASPEKFAAAGF